MDSLIFTKYLWLGIRLEAPTIPPASETPQTESFTMPLQLKQQLLATPEDVRCAVNLPPTGRPTHVGKLTALHYLDHDRLPLYSAPRVWEQHSWEHKHLARGFWNELRPSIAVNRAPRLLPPRSISQAALRNVNEQLQGRVADLEAAALTESTELEEAVSDAVIIGCLLTIIISAMFPSVHVSILLLCCCFIVGTNELLVAMLLSTAMSYQLLLYASSFLEPY